MKKHLIPYFKELGCPPEMLKNFENTVDEFTGLALHDYCSFFQKLPPREMEHEFEKLLSDSSAESYLNLLITTYPVENQRDINHLREQVEHEKMLRAQLKNSFSWRLTAPLRAVERLVKSKKVDEYM